MEESTRVKREVVEEIDKNLREILKRMSNTINLRISLRKVMEEKERKKISI